MGARIRWCDVRPETPTEAWDRERRERERVQAPPVEGMRLFGLLLLGATMFYVALWVLG